MNGLGVDVHPYYQRGAQFVGLDFGWIKMADGTRVYALRAEGRTWTADEHARRFREAGIPFGGYVYAQPGDGAAQAQVLWNECLRLGGTGVAPADDIEDNEKIHIWGTQEAINHGRSFCSAMRRIGVRPAIYMNDSMAGRTRPDDWPEDPVLWIARYGAAPKQTRYDVHQYTASGTLPGSAGLVDWNQAYTTAHLLTTNSGELVATEAEIKAIAKETVDEWMRRGVEVADSNPPRFLPASGFLTFTNGDTAAIRAGITQLLGKAGGATADEIAAKLLPALTSSMIAELRTHDAISDEDAQQIAAATINRAAALLTPGGAK